MSGKLCSVAVTLVALFAHAGAAHAETKEKCLQKKNDPAYWRQQIRDCDRADVSLFDGANAVSRDAVIEGIVAALSWRPMPTSYEVPKPASLILGAPSYALELEDRDQIAFYGECSAVDTEKVAFKHEVSFATLEQDGKARIGSATVYREANGAFACVATDTSTSAEVTPVK